MEINIPELSLVVVLGASGAGKTTFVQKHFQEEEILSQDAFLRQVAGTATHPKAREDAAETLAYVLGKRLKNGLLSVVDGTHVSQSSRKPLRLASKKYHVPLVGIWLDLPEEVLRKRNAAMGEAGSNMGKVKSQIQQLEAYDLNARGEGFRQVYRLQSEEEIAAITFKRTPLASDYQHLTGPFDIIGDVHGCYPELRSLMEKLGYRIESSGEADSWFKVSPPEGRKAIFVGDLVDRGPDTPKVVQLVLDMVRQGHALCVRGNHEDKLKRLLKGQKVKISHGRAQTLEQLDQQPNAFRQTLLEFIESMPSHVVLDRGELVVAHAGLKERMQGRHSGEVWAFALYGETSGEKDEFGFPVRFNWAGEYEGRAMVVYGHTPVPEAVWQNNTINIDTGCVFGGALTALRYPERELVQVPARETYHESTRPMNLNLPVPEQDPDQDFVDLERIAGRNLVSTRSNYFITIRDNASPAAMEFFLRTGISPGWYAYLPPYYSPPKSSAQAGYLEHPQEAFAYYEKKGLEQVMVEEMQGGTRVAILLAKHEGVARKRFKINKEGQGIVINTSGQRVFKTEVQEQAFLQQLAQGFSAKGLWEAWKTEWLCLEGELLPASLDWQDMEVHYPRLSTASRFQLEQSLAGLEASVAAGLDLEAQLQKVRAQLDSTARFETVYRHYYQPSEKLDQLRFVPSLLLATEGQTHFSKDQLWHRAQWKGLPEISSLFLAPKYELVSLDAETEKRAASLRFEEQSAKLGAGVWVRPMVHFTDQGQDLIQPALKVRGKEYLRLLYGIDYDQPDLLAHYRQRRLKEVRQRSVRQLSLGHEGLSRLVENQDLISVFECAFAHLSLLTVELDPRC